MGRRVVLMMVVLALVSLVVGGCTSREEKAARLQLKEAANLEQQKDLPAARDLLNALIKAYPETDSAVKARVVQQRIIKQMSGIEGELRKNLESLVLVLAGYQSMTGRPLIKLSELDSADYMFDTAYMTETIPAGVEAFILLDGKGGFRLWVYRGDVRMGMQRDNLQRHARPFEGAEVVAELRRDYSLEQVAANLVQLKPVITAGK